MNANAFVERLRALMPAFSYVDARERWRAAIGGGLGIACAALLSRWVAPGLDFNPWLVAPLGASAVLVFAVPTSPLAQPWAVIGGNTISALVGVACVRLVPDMALAGALAVGLAIGIMFATRCLHPPGGATALLVVLVQATDPRFALLPVLLNSALLVLAGALYNTMTGRRYPHRAAAAPPAPPAMSSRFTRADLDAALAHHNQVIDMSPDDLEALLHEAEAAAYQRTLGELRCADIMTRDLLTASAQQPIDAAWHAMHARSVKALPVIDTAGHLVGIVALADFMRQGGLAQLAPGQQPTNREARPQTVGQIMTRRVRVASADARLIELLPLFSEGGHHHLPIIDGEQRLVGIITQSDVVRALHRMVGPP
jgi:CBS domain-containing membrane protein